MSSSVYVGNKKDILILGKGPTDGLDDINLRKIIFYKFY